MKTFVRLAYILTILILIDLTATLYWLANDIAHEANPLMNFFLELSPLSFILAKLGMSGVGITILCFLRKRFKKIIFKTLLVLNLVYLALFLYHLWALLFLTMTTN